MHILGQILLFSGLTSKKYWEGAKVLAPTYETYPGAIFGRALDQMSYNHLTAKVRFFLISLSGPTVRHSVSLKSLAGLIPSYEMNVASPVFLCLVTSVHLISYQFIFICAFEILAASTAK